MFNTIFITANWTTGALSQQTISRQYDNNRYAVQFIGYPEGDGTEELDLYLLVWMSTAPGQKPGEITPIQLNSDQWYISNYFTQQVQVIKFQLCVLNEAGTYEAHSPIFSGRIGDSLEHDGTTQDIDVSTLFDAYREYLNELIIRAGAVVIDSTLSQSGQAADALETGDRIANLKNCNSYDFLHEISHNTEDLNAGIRYEWNKTNVCNVSGTATGSSINNIINNGLLADYGLEVGKTYPVKYQSTNVVLRIYCRVSGAFTQIVNTKTDTTFTVPEGTTDFTVRLTVPNGTTVSETISPKILTAKTNKELQEELTTTSVSLATIKRTEEGILTPYFAGWDVQFTDGVFSLLDMPLNTIAYTQFSRIDPAQVANFPVTDFGAVYIEKTGRGNFAFYRIYANNRPHIVCGYYSGGDFYWYCNQSIYPIKIGMLGDSVTAGRIGGESGNTNKGIPYWVMCETGMSVTNLGVGSQGWISKQYLNQNAEEYIQTLDLSSYDVLTFMYGANDGDIALGDYEDTTEQTIMGAVYRCVNYAMTQKPNLRIILINHPLGKGSTFPYYNPNTQHSASDHWRFVDYFEQLHLFGEKYAIPVIDGWKALNAWNRNTYIGDNIHPTVAGYKVIGQYIAGQIKALI